jgi:hypothetical protein
MNYFSQKRNMFYIDHGGSRRPIQSRPCVVYYEYHLHLKAIVCVRGGDAEQHLSFSPFLFRFQ